MSEVITDHWAELKAMLEKRAEGYPFGQFGSPEPETPEEYINQFWKDNFETFKQDVNDYCDIIDKYGILEDD